MILGWLLLGLLFQGTGNSSIEGIVVRSGTTEPIGGALVALTHDDASFEMRNSTPVATTDSAGGFKFEKLAAGTYRLLISANGYVRQEYGQRTFPGGGAQVTVTSGQSVGDLVVRMIPSGAVTGRVRDRNGRPLNAVPVRLMRYMYDETGLKTLRPYGTAQTDDRGEYRIYFVTPGQYYLHAGSAQGPGGYGPPARGPNEAASSYTAAYYPGVTEVTAASAIDVQPGRVWSGIDMTLARQTLYRVRGRVIDSATGKPPDSPAMWLFHFDPAIGRPAVIQGAANTGKFTYDRGQFEFRGVLPGPYTLGAGEKPNSNARAMRLGFMRIEVGSSNVEDVVLTIPPGATVSGRIALEGQTSPSLAFYEGAGFVSLMRTPDKTQPTMPRDWEALAKFAGDGSFQLNGVTAGEYRVELKPWMESRFYIKEIRYGLADALTRPFQVNPAQPARLEILLSASVAQASGIVYGTRSEPVSGAQVVLVPNQARDRSELFKATTTDQEGRFTIRNAAPGDYRMFAWEAIEPYFWFDPDILKRDEPFSTPIRLSESMSATATLRVIPAR